jgi:predicted metal-dependent hydrolase
MISRKSKECSIKFGKERIKIFLSFKERKTLKISVHPDKTLTVDAPKGKKLHDILARIRKRTPWIIKQRDYFERFQPLLTQRQYVSGECYYYLGRQYRLKVRKNSEQSVKLIGKYINVYASYVNNSNEIRKLLQGWYRKHAEAIFSQRLNLYNKVIKRMNVIYPEIKIRHMKKRWGSCGKAGAIVLNTELVKAPLHCIDYVIMHEICHLKISSHDNGFYKLLEKYMPDWKLRKERLERVII